MPQIIWPNNLPESWLQTPIRDVAEFSYGKALPSSQRDNSGSFNVYGSGGVTGKHSDAFIQDPTIIVGRKGSVGKVFVNESPCWCIDTAFYCSYLSQQVNLNYFAALLKFIDLSRFSITVGVPGLNRDDLYNILIPIPPLEEQQAIVDILQQAEQLRRLRQDSLAKAEKLAAALFLEMFGNPLENDRPKKSLGELGTLDRGLSKHRPRNAPHLFGGKYPFVQTGDVANSNGFIRQHSSTYSEEGLKQSKLWPKGTLCITIAANIANTGILQYEACFPDSVVGFIAGEKVTPEYVMFAVNVLQKVLESQATQSAQKNINLKVLRILSIPVPTKEELEKFTASVRDIYQVIDCNKEFDKQLSKTTQILESKAFSGCLTEAWRQEHPDIISSHVRANISTTAKAVNIAYGVSKPRVADYREIGLVDQLSQFQKTVWRYFVNNQDYVPNDLPALIAELPDEITANDQTRLQTTLTTLTALGLIAKVSLLDSEGHYTTAYRAVHEDDQLQNFKLPIEDQGLSGVRLKTVEW